jgi:hypothetical protein
VLSLPLKAESLVDKELAEKRDDSHDDSDTVFVLVCVDFDPSRCGLGDSPEDDNCGLC